MDDAGGALVIGAAAAAAGEEERGGQNRRWNRNQIQSHAEPRFRIESLRSPAEKRAAGGVDGGIRTLDLLGHNQVP